MRSFNQIKENLYTCLYMDSSPGCSPATGPNHSLTVKLCLVLCLKGKWMLPGAFHRLNKLVSKWVNLSLLQNQIKVAWLRHESFHKLNKKTNNCVTLGHALYHIISWWSEWACSGELAEIATHKNKQAERALFQLAWAKADGDNVLFLNEATIYSMNHDHIENSVRNIRLISTYQGDA